MYSYVYQVGTLIFMAKCVRGKFTSLFISTYLEIHLYLASSIMTSKIRTLEEFTAVHIFKYPNCFVPGEQGNIHSSENIEGSNARTFPPTRSTPHERGGIETPQFDSNPQYLP